MSAEKKKRSWFLPFVMLALILMGGGWLLLADKKATVSREEVSRKTRDAIQATKRYTAEEQHALERALQAELTAMRTNINSLKAKSERSTGQARVDLQNAITDLEQKKNTAREKLVELKSVSSDGWGSVKVGMDRALEDMKESYERALAKVKD